MTDTVELTPDEIREEVAGYEAGCSEEEARNLQNEDH